MLVKNTNTGGEAAHSVIFVHNHPSGNTKPSQSDIFSIQKLRNAGQTLEIEVTDALIITEDDYSSFFDKLKEQDGNIFLPRFNTDLFTELQAKYMCQLYF